MYLEREKVSFLTLDTKQFKIEIDSFQMPSIYMKQCQRSTPNVVEKDLENSFYMLM